MLFIMVMMKPIKNGQCTERERALDALKRAILEGATWRYEHLADIAVIAGATDEDIDMIAHEAVRALFDCAEQPVTPRQLAHAWGGSHFRH